MILAPTKLMMWVACTAKYSCGFHARAFYFAPLQVEHLTLRQLIKLK